MTTKRLSTTAGLSYIVIFFSAIFANFYVLDALKAAPLSTIQQQPVVVGVGILAFMLAVIFDIVVAWALQLLYPKHPLTLLSTFFRMTHAVLFAIAVFALMNALKATSGEAISELIMSFENMWLIGLFFFGLHLILVTKIIPLPRLISIMLVLAGVMYMVDTSAHILMQNYSAYQDLFLTLVAVPSILGEMSFAGWLLWKGSKK